MLTTLGNRRFQMARSKTKRTTRSDPIFTLIEAHRLAVASIERIGKGGGPQGLAKDDARFYSAGRDVTAAEDALMGSTPTTLAEAVALLRYARDCASRGYSIFERYDDPYSRALMDWAERALKALTVKRTKDHKEVISARE